MLIEKIIRDHLNAVLPEGALLFEPVNKNPKSGSFVVIEKTGTQQTDWLYTATVAVQSYAPTLYQAAELDQRARNAMFALPDSSEYVTGVHLIGGSNFTDPSTRQPRYQAVFDVNFYEE